jgi:hypothetical protein
MRVVAEPHRVALSDVAEQDGAHQNALDVGGCLRHAVTAQQRSADSRQRPWAQFAEAYATDVKVVNALTTLTSS